MDNSNSVEFDLAELLGGNIDSITAKFADLSADNLAKLKELENADKKRSTLTGAIDAELAKRAEEAEQKKRDEEAAQAKRADDEAADDASKPLTFDKATVDRMLSEQETRLKAEHKAEVDRLKAKQPKAGAGGAGKAPAKPLAVSAKAADLEEVGTLGVTQIVLVDDERRPFADLPNLSFQPHDYRFSAGRLILDRDIEFPMGLPGRDVMGAFVLDGYGEPVGFASLVAPFRIGGGVNAKLARNSLSFEGAAA